MNLYCNYPMKKILLCTLLILTITACGKETKITNFKECADAGNPIMESYPQQCRTADGRTFTEEIGNELDKTDLIRIDKPRPNSVIEPSFDIEGHARGYWFFEGSFPLVLEDTDGNILAQHYTTAQGEWMTEEFVKFSAEMKVDFGNATTGYLVLKRDNPSDLPENDDELRVPLMFDAKLSDKADITDLPDELNMDNMKLSETTPISVDYSGKIEEGSPLIDFIDTLETKYTSPDESNLLVVSASEESPDKEILLIDKDHNYKRVLFCGTPCDWHKGGWISDDVFFVTGINEDIENSNDHRPVLYLFNLDSNTVKTFNGPVIPQP